MRDSEREREGVRKGCERERDSLWIVHRFAFRELSGFTQVVSVDSIAASYNKLPFCSTAIGLYDFRIAIFLITLLTHLLLLSYSYSISSLLTASISAQYLSRSYEPKLDSTTTLFRLVVLTLLHMLYAALAVKHFTCKFSALGRIYFASHFAQIHHLLSFWNGVFPRFQFHTLCTSCVHHTK